MLYLDSTYIFRLYFPDPGWEAVRSLAAGGIPLCSVIGEAECAGVFHRKFRERALSLKDFTRIAADFHNDSQAGAIKWIPLSQQIVAKVVECYRTLPPSIALRAADAIHLATARECGCTEIYTNDFRMLQAAAHFGLRGVNVI